MNYVDAQLYLAGIVLTTERLGGNADEIREIIQVLEDLYIEKATVRGMCRAMDAGKSKVVRGWASLIREALPVDTE